MNISVKTQDNKADWEMIRIKVFMEEQGFQTEFDDIDEIATHLTIYEDDKPVACARLYPDPEHEGWCEFGRIAVRKEARGRGYGKMLVRELEKQAVLQKYPTAFLSAQCHASGMYKELGYEQCGDIVYDEHVPHIGMSKKLG